MGKDYRYSKDDALEREDKFFNGKIDEDDEKHRRHKKRQHSALSRKQRQQHTH